MFDQQTADLIRENAKLKQAVEMMSIGANHIACVLIGRLGAGFADKFPPQMPAWQVLEKLGAGDDYEIWCCWSAAMRTRDVLEGPRDAQQASP